MRVIPQSECDRIANPHAYHGSGYLAIVGHIAKFGTGFDFSVDFASLELNLVMDRMASCDGWRNFGWHGHDSPILGGQDSASYWMRAFIERFSIRCCE